MTTTTVDARRKGMVGQQVKDIIYLVVGIFLYGFGYTAFILPDQVVMGGVAGISALVYYASGFPPAITICGLNILLLAISFKALSRLFVIRTIMGFSLLTFFVGWMQPFFQAYPVITAGDDKFMHVLLGGALCGSGLGIAFTHNGSTGGTDIIFALLNKYFRMSFGRAMQCVDIGIICSSYLLFHSIETIVYGIALVLVMSYVCDWVVNGTRQTVQFLIFSKKYEEVADGINHQIHRGVTVIRGTGWYSKGEVEMLIVMARKYESRDVFNLIKRIDPNALVSQSFCHGVFGQGFDKI